MAAPTEAAMSDSATKERIEQLLRDLGDTEEAVAAKLTKLGCFGDRSSCRSCPVARYLTRATGIVWTVHTGCAIARLCDLRVILPRPVNAFIDGFDVFDRWQHLVDTSD
jgi:hypothetical protein